MDKRLFILFISLFLTLNVKAQNFDEAKVKAALRQVGHELLLSYGDSVSRILPVQKIGNRYKVAFDSTHNFNAEKLVLTVEKIALKTELPKNFVVEVERCFEQNLIYSYEVSEDLNTDLVACQTREHEEGCFDIYFSFPSITDLPIQDNIPQQKPKQEVKEASKNTMSKLNLWLIVVLIIVFVIYLAYLKLKKKPTTNTDLITIGAYIFDKRNDELILKKEIIELSGKESELLYLLHSNKNNVVKKEDILNKVWGDEGDYIGRTLDVFISKLRKKLANDQNLKIVNIRGVGYKLVVN